MTYAKYSGFGGGSGGEGIATYATFADFPASAPNGSLALALDTDILYAYNTGSASWVIIAGPDVALSVGTIDAGSPSANGAHILSDQLIMQSASGTVPGLVNLTTQTLAGNKTFTGTIAASNLSGTNTGDVTITAVGSSPSADGASLSGQVFTLQPANASFPGLLSAAQYALLAGATSASTASTLVERDSGSVIYAGGLSLDTNGAWINLGAGGGYPGNPTDGGIRIFAESSDGSTFAWVNVNNEVIIFDSNAVTTTDRIFITNQTSGGTLLTTNGDTMTSGGFAMAGFNVTGAGIMSSGEFLSTTASPAAAGLVRLANADSINWRNAANSADNTLSMSTNTLTYSGAFAASNFSGTNTGDVTLAAVGSSPSANGASLSSQVLTLQPADATHPGLMTTGTQTIAGVKTWNGEQHIVGQTAATTTLLVTGAASESGKFFDVQTSGAASLFNINSVGNFNFGSGILTVGGQIQTQSGSAGTPTYSVSGETSSGLYRSGTNEYSFSSNSAQVVKFNGSGTTELIAHITPIQKNTAAQTTLTGAAGTAVCSQPEQGTSYKKVIVYLNAYTDTGTQTFTYPTAFSHTPYVYGLSGGVSGATATTTTVTFTTTLLSGFVFIEGF